MPNNKSTDLVGLSPTWPNWPNVGAITVASELFLLYALEVIQPQRSFARRLIVSEGEIEVDPDFCGEHIR